MFTSRKHSKPRGNVLAAATVHISVAEQQQHVYDDQFICCVCRACASQRGCKVVVATFVHGDW